MDKNKHKKKRVLVKKKKVKINLPKRLLYVPSIDKNFTEKWTKNRDPLNIPGMRIILCGKPGCSKTMMIKNIIMTKYQMECIQ